MAKKRFINRRQRFLSVAERKFREQAGTGKEVPSDPHLNVVVNFRKKFINVYACSGGYGDPGEPLRIIITPRLLHDLRTRRTSIKQIVESRLRAQSAAGDSDPSKRCIIYYYPKDEKTHK